MAVHERQLQKAGVWGRLYEWRRELEVERVELDEAWTLLQKEGRQVVNEKVSEGLMLGLIIGCCVGIGVGLWIFSTTN